MKYTSVIFDWDGTIAMTLHLWLAGYREELGKLGYAFSDEVIVEDFFYEHDKACLKYPEINFGTFIEGVRDYVASHIPKLALYPGVYPALKKLHAKGVTLCLVSSSSRRLLEEGLEKTGLDIFFDTIVSGDDVMRHKPHPEPFEQAIDVAQLDRASSIITGDSHNDIIASKAASLTSCLFLPKENKLFYDFEKLKRESPTYHIHTMEEFAEIILASMD